MVGYNTEVDRNEACGKRNVLFWRKASLYFEMKWEDVNENRLVFE